METARRRVLVSTPAPDDDSGTVGESGQCTVKQDNFARALAETGNASAAYRIAYNVHEHTMPNVVWASASRLAALPHVKKRIQEIQQQLVLETIVSAREALQWQLDIATADPNEVVYVAVRACRNCHGIGHKYQWVDEDEFIVACAKTMDEGKVPPDDVGGYGYSRGASPALDCPNCLGAGLQETVIKDTTKLTGKARKLYAGAKQDRYGQIEVKLHDQKAAWEMVCRMLGAFNDKLDLRTPAERKGATKIPDGLSEQETTRAYLAMLD